MLKQKGRCDDCDGPECESCGGVPDLSESTETAGYISVDEKGKDKLSVFEEWVSVQHGKSGDPWFHVHDIVTAIEQIRKEM